MAPCKRPAASVPETLRKRPAKLETIRKRPACKIKVRKKPSNGGTEARGYSITGKDPNALLSKRLIDAVHSKKFEIVMSNLSLLNDKIPLFSMCTGGNMMTVQAKLFADEILERTGRKLKVIDKFICELMDSKADFAMHVASEADPGGDTCSFNDLRLLPRGLAKCRQHEGAKKTLFPPSRWPLRSVAAGQLLRVQLREFLRAVL